MWRCEELTHLKRPWCWERLKAGGEGDDRGWDGWMASLTQWKWVWVGSGSWQWTGRPGVLQSMGLQRVRHDWVTELNWSEISGFSLLVWRGLRREVQTGKETRFFCSVFYWSTVDLQCCVKFWCTAEWFSYTYIFFSYSFPWWFIPGYWI